MSDPDLARKYSVSHTTIIKLRRKHGIKSYQKPKAHIDWQHWDAFVADETMTAEGLATLMGVDISTVRKRRRLLQAGNLG